MADDKPQDYSDEWRKVLAEPEQSEFTDKIDRIVPDQDGLRVVYKMPLDGSKWQPAEFHVDTSQRPNTWGEDHTAILPLHTHLAAVREAFASHENTQAKLAEDAKAAETAKVEAPAESDKPEEADTANQPAPNNED